MQPARPARDRAARALTATKEPRSTVAEHGRRPRGQVLVIFVMSIFVLLGICAVVIDVSWYWANTLRVQRAADAACLAGVVSLPGDTVNAGKLAVQAAGPK